MGHLVGRVRVPEPHSHDRLTAAASEDHQEVARMTDLADDHEAVTLQRSRPARRGYDQE